MKTICGFDPGKTGGLTIISGDEVEMHAMPVLAKELDLAAITDILVAAMITKAYVEQVHAMPKNGAVSMFSFGKGYGSILGILSALRIPYALVTPQKWQKTMYEGVSGKAQGKDRSVLAATRLYPALDFKATPRSRTPHMGLVDSLLIAEYGRRQK